ncbi:MAG: transcription/translation regulatory transformer protein RfaH [Gammaproteobacteria bacterium]|nr:transcription/translation regulatory transformer protein RfaH [Gammaproteobacteria bacterium]
MPRNDPTDEAWYLIYSKPRGERLARENLARQGYETYLPLVRARARRGRRAAGVVEPMFPRYLFVYLDAVNQSWAPIRSTLGVARLVRFGTWPARVPDGLIRRLRDEEDEHGVQRREPRDFQQGQQVRIRSGPMAGYAAVFAARTGEKRVQVLLEIADQTARVSLPSVDVETIL